jgi:pimeloyl-ACP methyl ester carboxylesterase
VTPVLFLSGAGLPTWIWDDVRSRLDGDSRVAGRPVDNPPSEEHPGRPSGDAPLEEYVDHALAAVEGEESFVVVAHSAGGVVGAALLARAAERVTGFVGIAACLPDADQSFVGSLPFPQRHLLGLVMRVAGTRPPAKGIRNGVAAGLPEDTADRIVEDFTPESQRFYRDRAPARSFPERSAYLLTTRDREFPVTLQETYSSRLGGRVERLDAGHLPMLEQPEAVASAISRVLA